jgi:AraC-like DNA-binding protein
MVIESTKPDVTLQPFIKEYYYFHLQATVDEKQIPLIDDGCYDFIFFKEAKANFFYGETRQCIPMQHTIFTIHDLKPPYRMSFSDSITFFTIKVQPWMNAYFFSNTQTKGIVNITTDELVVLYNELCTETSMEARFNLANTYMHAQQLALTPSIKFVKTLCEYIYAERGMVSVNDLTTIFGKSRQYLNKIFKQEVLYSLKKFIITVRILDLVKYKVKQPELSLTKLSYDYGYFDQSHFIRDFKNVAGATPTYFFNNLPEFMLRH